jgi:uncharacterized damage-inducible protein DinB
MPDPAELFLAHSRDLLASDYLSKIRRSLEALTDDDIWWRPNDASNSAGNLVLHLCGNVTQWILGGVGQREYVRKRQEEFDERGPLPKDDLLARLDKVVSDAAGVIGAVDPKTLTSRRSIQGYDVTVLEAIYHVVEHFSMHTGQIILIAKARTGANLKLWP